jgi:hypothetical protein
VLFRSSHLTNPHFLPAFRSIPPTRTGTVNPQNKSPIHYISRKLVHNWYTNITFFLFEVAHRQSRLSSCESRRLGSYVPILLQKSQIARRQFSCCKKIRPTTADRCGLNDVTEVASEFIFTQMRSPTSLHETRRPRSGEFLITSAKRLFQQHRSKPEFTAPQQRRPVQLADIPESTCRVHDRTAACLSPCVLPPTHELARAEPG